MEAAIATFSRTFRNIFERGGGLSGLAEEIKREPPSEIVRAAPEISTPIRFPPRLPASLARYPHPAFLSNTARGGFDLLLEKKRKKREGRFGDFCLNDPCATIVSLLFISQHLPYRVS